MNTETVKKIQSILNAAVHSDADVFKKDKMMLLDLSEELETYLILSTKIQELPICGPQSLASLSIQKSKFSSTWRPLIGWTCGIALMYISVIEPIMRFIAMVSFGYTGSFPLINEDITLQVLGLLLGLSISRTVEKVKGVTK